MATSDFSAAGSAVSQMAGQTVAASRRKRHFGLYLWLAPALIIYSIFKLAPLLGGLALSVLRWDGVEDPVVVGLANFERLLGDEKFFQALGHNVEYAIGTVVGKIVLALFLALLLNQALRGRSIYRTVLFTPVVMSFVVVSLIWTWLLNDQFGLINNFLRAIGLKSLAKSWLGTTDTALGALVLVDIWKWYGFHMVIFLAGLQTIPTEYYEAARVDGASRWRQFRHITLPLLQPVMAINVTLALLGAFNVFEIPYIMTEGGPANATNVIALHSYLQAFKFYRIGYGAALGYAILAIVTVIALVQLALQLRDRNSEPSAGGI